MHEKTGVAERLLSDSYWRSGDRKTVKGNEYPLLESGEFDLVVGFGHKLTNTYQRMKETAVVEKPLSRGMSLPLVVGNIISKKLLRVVIDERITRGQPYRGSNADTEGFDADAAAIGKELAKPFEEQRWHKGCQAVYSVNVADGGYVIPTTIARSVYYALRPEGEESLVGGLAGTLEPFSRAGGLAVFRAIPPLVIGEVYEMPAIGKAEHLQRVVRADKIEQTYYAAVSDEAKHFAESLGQLLSPRPVMGGI